MRFLVFSVLKLIFLLSFSTFVSARVVMEGQKMNNSSLQSIEVIGRIKDEAKNNSKASQILLQNETSCPKSTIPIRRSTIADDMIRNKHYSYRKPQELNSIEYALAVYSPPGKIYGAQAILNVCNPSVEEEDEFSLAQISLTYGKHEDAISIEAGWHVFPSLYGDTKTRFYIFWTEDMYSETGCYNLFCEGFLHTAEKWILRDPLIPSSGGDDHHMTIYIRKGLKGDWLVIIDGRMIGQWPEHIFSHTEDYHNTRVEWGGWVSNARANNKHTSTMMGAGHLAVDGIGKASYFHNLKVLTENDDLMSVPLANLSKEMTDEKCYSIHTFAQREGHETSFLYGGPGFSDECP